jgi:hypothetical protein
VWPHDSTRARGCRRLTSDSDRQTADLRLVRIDRIELDNALCFRHLTLQIDHSFQLVAGANNAGASCF